MEPALAKNPMCSFEEAITLRFIYHDELSVFRRLSDTTRFARHGVEIQQTGTARFRAAIKIIQPGTGQDLGKMELVLFWQRSGAQLDIIHLICVIPKSIFR